MTRTQTCSQPRQKTGCCYLGGERTPGHLDVARLPHQAAEGVDVGEGADALAPRALGRHPRRRPIPVASRHLAVNPNVSADARISAVQLIRLV